LNKRNKDNIYNDLFSNIIEKSELKVLIIIGQLNTIILH